MLSAEAAEGFSQGFPGAAGLPGEAAVLPVCDLDQQLQRARGARGRSRDVRAEPQMHIYFDDRAQWVAVGDDLPRLGGKTGFEARPQQR